MPKITTSKFQKGTYIKFRNEPCMIISFQFVNPGKGSAFTRTRLKNVKTGRVQEFTFKSGEQVEELSIRVSEKQYLYQETDNFIFMDKKTYEQIHVSKKVIGDFSKFLKEGDTYQILIYENKAIGINKPKKVKLKVVSAEEAVKGNTATGAKKTVTLETGIEINVPLFIKQGDLVYIDPESGQYLERVNK